jgi:hypothetical protein
LVDRQVDAGERRHRRQGFTKVTMHAQETTASRHDLCPDLAVPLWPMFYAGELSG